MAAGKGMALERVALFFVLFGLCCQPPVAPASPHLLYELLTSLGTGQGSCEQVARIARTIGRGSDTVHRSIEELAGLDINHLERDFHRWARRQVWRELLPELYTFPLAVSADTGPAMRQHAAILPHELFGNLFHRAPELFRMLFTGEVGNLEGWWAEAAACGGSWYSEHPVVHNTPDPCLRVPFGLHGDDAGSKANGKSS